MINTIKAQNKDSFDENSAIEIISCKKMRDKEVCVATVKIDLSSFKKIMKSKRINIGWNRCRVYEYVEVTRCFKCNAYGHIAQNCTADNFFCPLCADNHQINECKAEAKDHKCINCIRENKKTNHDADVNHCALSLKCPILQKKSEKRKLNIRYEK